MRRRLRKPLAADREAATIALMIAAISLLHHSTAMHIHPARGIHRRL